MTGAGPEVVTVTLVTRCHGPSPDVGPEVHGVLLEGELGAGDEHRAREHRLEGEQGGGQAGVDRHVVH